MSVQKAIEHMKSRLKYCSIGTTIDKYAIELSIEGLKELERAKRAIPIEEWHEDYGDCIWWTFPIEEPPYVGSPLEDNFPDGFTHFTRIIIPKEFID